MNSRQQFFSRLQKATRQVGVSVVSQYPPPPKKIHSHSEEPDLHLNRFKKIMLSQKTEIIDYPSDDDHQGQKKVWIDLWASLNQSEGKISKIAYSSQISFHPSFNAALESLQQKNSSLSESLQILYTDREKNYLQTEKDKISFLNYQVGITEVEAGLADTGSLLLIPSREEPRVLSLVPPIHIAVLSKKRILAGLREWFQLNPKGLPPNTSNLVLISGPSKTADIEKRLVHGVHGPRRLILLLGN